MRVCLCTPTPTAQDGEDVYEYSYHPLSLLIAKSIFLHPDIRTLMPASKSLAWWTMRYGRVHQDLLEQNSVTLKTHMDAVIPIALANYGVAAAAASSSAGSSTAAAAPAAVTPLQHRLTTHVYMEACHVFHSYWQYRQIEECLAETQRQLGVEVELTGLMGKRTRWQKEEKAQLLVRVIPSDKRLAEMEEEKKNPSRPVDPLLIELLPHSLALDSDVLLPTLALSSPDQSFIDAPLSVCDQALLLAIFENTNRTASSHITRDEKMMAYIARLLEEQRSGRTSSVHTLRAQRIMGKGLMRVRSRTAC